MLVLRLQLACAPSFSTVALLCSALLCCCWIAEGSQSRARVSLPDLLKASRRDHRCWITTGWKLDLVLVSAHPLSHLAHANFASCLNCMKAFWTTLSSGVFDNHRVCASSRKCSMSSTGYVQAAWLVNHLFYQRVKQCRGTCMP